MFSLTFNTDNAAFTEGNRQFEIARILGKISCQMNNGSEGASILAINGNVVGSWGLI